MRLVSLESVREALERNLVPFEEYKDWSDEKVVDKLLQLLSEKPRTELPEGMVRARLPDWLAVHVTEEETPEEAPEEFDRGHFTPLARALGDCQTSRALGPLSRALSSSDEYVVAAAARALGKIKDVSVPDKLSPLLSHQQKRVRVAAAEALARLGRREGLDALRRMMGEREEWQEERFTVRHFHEVDCAQILYELGEPSGMELLVEYLNHPSFMAVAEALSALEAIGAPESARAVSEHLSRESDVSNTLTCVRILARLGDLSQLHRVTEILVAGKPGDRQRAAGTCHSLGFTVFLGPLRKRLSVEGHKEVRESIERAIHRIEKSPVVVEAPPLEVEEPLELIARLGQKLLRNPKDEAAWERKAEEEVYYFTTQLEQGGDRLEALRRLGFAYLFGPFGAGRIRKAEECFKEVLAEKPDDPVALFGLARTLIMWSGGCNEERKSMLLRAKAACKEPLVNLYGWPGNDLEIWLRRCL